MKIKGDMPSRVYHLIFNESLNLFTINIVRLNHRNIRLYGT